AGGTDDHFTVVARTVLYDPANGTWAASGNLIAKRSHHTATLLPNGTVLVAAGVDYSLPFGNQQLASAELYDPATGIWTNTGALAQSRADHTATLLPNGKVLIAGGDQGVLTTIASCELYDPTSGTWTETGSLHNARAIHTATLLPDGNVLVTGGLNFNQSGYLASAEVYNTASGTWTEVGKLATKPGYQTATLLPNGKALVTGGVGDLGVGDELSSAELYNPASGTWQTTGSLATARFVHGATLLPNGKVLVEGGEQFPAMELASAELYDPASGTWTTTG